MNYLLGMLLKEEKIEGKIEVTGRQGRGSNQLLVALRK
jgi:hypothetical protein